MNISVIGLGKLGAVLAALYSNSGHNVIGVDKSEDIVSKINKRESPFNEPKLQELISKSESTLQATTDIDFALENSEATFIIVPTPSNGNGSFNNDFVLDVVRSIGNKISSKNSFHTIILSSTVLPGTCEDLLVRELELLTKKKVGLNFGFVYSPEFIALGSIVLNMTHPDIVLIGASDNQSSEIAKNLLLSVTKNSPDVYRMNLINAELVKIAINTYVTMKISFANMLSDICSRLPTADSDVVNDAVGGDSRIGKKYLRGAVGYGGPCFPRDNAAMTFLFESKGLVADLPKATNATNNRQIDRILELVENKFPNVENIAILGVSYKPETPVIEGSQSILLAEKLVRLGKKITLHDPSAIEEMEKSHFPFFELSSNLEITISRNELLIIMTPWEQYEQISRNLLSGKNIIDCWRVLQKHEIADSNILFPGVYHRLENTKC